MINSISIYLNSVLTTNKAVNVTKCPNSEDFQLGIQILIKLHNLCKNNGFTPIDLLLALC